MAHQAPFRSLLAATAGQGGPALAWAGAVCRAVLLDTPAIPPLYSLQRGESAWGGLPRFCPFDWAQGRPVDGGGRDAG